jgi:murein L,D-transpeptidase YcbB/YkuD
MFRLWAWDGGGGQALPVVQMGVIVGRAVRTQTPVFADEMTHLIFRPYWNVPRSILVNEVLPAAERDPNYLQRNDMQIVAGQGDDARPRAATPENLAAAREGRLRVRQLPGPRNALGLVKFIFPNDDNVYLHDTPAQRLFGRSRRDFSHGCVRVEDPVALAQWALKDEPEWTRERIVAVMQGSQTMQVNLRRPLPVLLYYITAAVTPDDGAVHFAEDIYGHDPKLERALARPRAN